MIFIQMYQTLERDGECSILYFVYFIFIIFNLQSEKSSKPLLMTTVPYIKIIYEQPPFAFLF